MVSNSRGGGISERKHNIAAYSICLSQSNFKISIRGRINFRIAPLSVYITNIVCITEPYFLFFKKTSFTLSLLHSYWDDDRDRCVHGSCVFMHVDKVLFCWTDWAEWTADYDLLTVRKLGHLQECDESLLCTMYISAICVQTGNTEVSYGFCWMARCLCWRTNHYSIQTFQYHIWYIWNFVIWF